MRKTPAPPRPHRRLDGHSGKIAKNDRGILAIEVQEPIEVDGDDQAVHDKVIASLQGGVDRLAARRRFPVIG